MQVGVQKGLKGIRWYEDYQQICLLLFEWHNWTYSVIKAVKINVLIYN